MTSGTETVAWLREMQNRVPESYLWDRLEGLDNAAAEIERLRAALRDVEVVLQAAYVEKLIHTKPLDLIQRVVREALS